MTLPPDDVASPWYVRAHAPAEALRAALGEVTVLARAGAPEEETAVLVPAMMRNALVEKLSGIAVTALFRVLED